MFLLFELKLFDIHGHKLIANEQKMSSTNFLSFTKLKQRTKQK